jgi:uncharacterized protein with FMN-binding domain
MKKYILGLGVILIFAGYVIYSKNNDDDKINVVPPAGLTTTTTATSSAGSNSSSMETANPAAGGTPPVTTTTTPTPTPAPVAQGQYKDGSYTSPVSDAYFGSLQIKATISGGKITDVAFLQYPNDNHNSVQINTQAMPYLKAEAIQAQSANVNIISGATQTSQAFQQALATVLSQAKN